MKRKKRMAGGSVKGSYTVEASWIMVISLGILMAFLLCGYELFYRTLEDVSRPGQEIDCVTVFRESRWLEEIS